MIIDVHCRLGTSRTLEMTLTPEKLGAALDESGIERACCFLVPDAILNEGLPMIQGTVLFAAASIIVSNFARDLLYGWIDPCVLSAKPRMNRGS